MLMTMGRVFLMKISYNVSIVSIVADLDCRGVLFSHMVREKAPEPTPAEIGSRFILGH
jgi:hypothetical protein